MDDTLGGVPSDPETERHGGALVVAEHEHDGGDEDEGEVPEEIERHHGAGVGPIRLPLLQLLRRGLPHQQRRLPHRSAPAPPQQPRRAPERRPAQRAPAAPPETAEERRRVQERVAAGARGTRCRHRGNPSEIAGKARRRARVTFLLLPLRKVDPGEAAKAECRLSSRNFPFFFSQRRRLDTTGLEGVVG